MPPLGKPSLYTALTPTSLLLKIQFILGATLIIFCGVVVPYEKIQAFWRY